MTQETHMTKLSDEQRLKESLAAIEHERWTDWHKTLFKKCIHQENGELVIPKSFVEEWQKLMDTPYQDLSEDEKDRDRREVERYWGLVK